MRDMGITISLKCNVCGNDQFSVVDKSIQNIEEAEDEVEVKCSDCGRITTKEQLLVENKYIIDANIEDLEEMIIKEIQKDLKSFLR